ncbi:BMP family lipoprotein [Clostridium culturomicium]|uniref:BMP family lipoprotein n=1 Tax=Clostridium culturomicium TaxID=1499683 RepID=UPI00058BB653|nr:BMP family ABC transporter substrate-binding protein [Clostridium culturomicium]
MKMKRIVALLATVAMTATLLVGCASPKDGGSTGDTSKGDEGTKSEVFIGLSTDEGGINDKSFNQTANDGVVKAEKEFGLKYKYLEATKKEDYEPNLQGLIDEGADLTFAIGYQLSDAVKNIAKNNADSKLCLIDSVVDAPNVLSITFKEEEGSFLMGVIAGLTTKTNKVGFIGGKDQETIVKFEAGFAAGVAAVNPEAAKGLISPDGKAVGTTVKYADSFADTNKGYELAKSLYDDGVDVIYHAAGGCGIGLFQATKELKEKGQDVWAIGVDMDQQVSLPEYADVMLSSMMKRVDNATYDAAKSVVDGTFEGGNKVLGIAEGGVGMSDSTSKNTDAKVIEKAKEFEEKIKKGEIKVPGTRAEVKDFKVN